MVRQVSVVLAVILGLMVTAGLVGFAVAQPITVNEATPFQGELVGYGEEVDTPGHQVDVSGDFQFTGENAHDVRIEVTPSDWTVLDMSSVSVRIEGAQPVAFDRTYAQDTVILTADEVPAGTIVELRLQTVYTGGTDEETLPVAHATFEYATAGETIDSTSYTAQADIEESADRVVNDLRAEEPATWQIWLSYLAIGLFVVLVAITVNWYRNWRQREFPTDDESGPGPRGGPPP